jgi:hypothetical protein
MSFLFRNLLKLRRAYRADGWGTVLSDVIDDGQRCSEGINDGQIAAECFWELASMDPERYLDTFESQLSQYSSWMSQITLDFGSVYNRLVSGAFSFLTGHLTFGEQISFKLSICNMSPMILSIRRVILEFSQTDKFEIVLGNPEEVIPGTHCELFGNLQQELVAVGTLSLNVLKIELNDLPICLVFPGSALTSKERGHLTGWECEETTNWTFLRLVSRYNHQTCMYLLG